MKVVEVVKVLEKVEFESLEQIISTLCCESKGIIRDVIQNTTNQNRWAFL